MNESTVCPFHVAPFLCDRREINGELAMTSLEERRDYCSTNQFRHCPAYLVLASFLGPQFDLGGGD